jgi:hypothetical protein
MEDGIAGVRDACGRQIERIFSPSRYLIDSRDVERYGEPNHVDVSRLDGYERPLDKRRFAFTEDG